MPDSIWWREAAEPVIDEPEGLLELPISGWVTDVRVNTVRLHCFIRRRSGFLAPIAILHAPVFGFGKSLHFAVKRWGSRGGGSMQ